METYLCLDFSGLYPTVAPWEIKNRDLSKDAKAYKVYKIITDMGMGIHYKL